MKTLTLLLLPALAACATATPEATPAAAPPAAPAAAAAPAGIGAGTYTSTIAAADIPAGAPADMATGMVGEWQLVTNGSGQAMVSYNGRQVVTAPYQVNGNEITFAANDTGEYACNAAGRYSWRISGGQLYFTKIEDTCQGRAIALTAHPWSARR
ncbi:MAG TPA: hypothetical protein VF771_20600 [Longimicrobiaceae bacterium]